jgi:hypothetical protein
MIEENRQKIVGVEDSIDAAFDMIDGIFSDPMSLPEELNGATLKPTERITRIERDENGIIQRRTTMIAFEASSDSEIHPCDEGTSHKQFLVEA